MGDTSGLFNFFVYSAYLMYTQQDDSCEKSNEIGELFKDIIKKDGQGISDGQLQHMGSHCIRLQL